jgi:hypothetical protein
MPHDHEFDPVSGWCAHCTYRDDGRLTNAGGTVYRTGTTNQQENDNEHDN